MYNWQPYIDKTKNKPPRELLVRALEFIKEKKIALDLGAGALNDTKFLIESGFEKVIAIDSEENSEVLSGLDKKIIFFKKRRIEEYDFPLETFNLVNAQFVLPFIAKDELPRVMRDIEISLKKDGIFVGQFFGPRDSWATHTDVSVYAQKEVEQFFAGMKVIYFKEEEKDYKTLLKKEKHWHIFHFIVRKNNIK